MIRFVSFDEAGGQLEGWLSDLSGRLRSSDLDEITASSGLPPYVAVVGGALVSDMGWVMLDDDDPICVFGVAPSGHPEAGVVWMVGTDRMKEPRIARAVLRHSVPFKERMHDLYPCLFNFIDARNTASLKWLQWTGYRLLEAHPEWGREGRLFYTFARYRPRV